MLQFTVDRGSFFQLMIPLIGNYYKEIQVREMIKVKTLMVVFLIISTGLMGAQEFDKTLYERTTLLEVFDKYMRINIENIKYYKADVIFLGMSQIEGEFSYSFEDLDGSIESSMGGEPVLFLPERGQVVTIYFRLFPVRLNRERIFLYYMEIPRVSECTNNTKLSTQELESDDPLPEPITQATPFDSPEESLINSAAHGQNDKNAVFWIAGILGLLFMVCCIFISC